MNLYGKHVDILAVSCDSFDPATNAAIGRGEDADNNGHVERVLAYVTKKTTTGRSRMSLAYLFVNCDISGCLAYTF